MENDINVPVCFNEVNDFDNRLSVLSGFTKIKYFVLPERSCRSRCSGRLIRGFYLNQKKVYIRGRDYTRHHFDYIHMMEVFMGMVELDEESDNPYYAWWKWDVNAIVGWDDKVIKRGVWPLSWVSK